jgi:endonuclease/exonuclease/phosphatase family metal-dependent hydrolase
VVVRVRVVDWNIDGFTRIDAKLSLLRDLDWDLLLLQEITVDSWEEFRQLGSAGVWSHAHLPALARLPRYHSAILVRGGLDLVDVGVVPEVPSPERTALARVVTDDGSFMAASLALPPGVAWGKAGKGRQADRIASWLAARREPVLVGIDANTPKADHPELAQCVWWNSNEPLLLGADRIHDLRDVYRELLQRDDERRAAVLEARPEGPLAVSHVRGRGDRRTDCRYDHLLASPEFAVADVRYLWDEALTAGSDHALISAELVLHRDPPRTPATADQVARVAASSEGER